MSSDDLWKPIVAEREDSLIALADYGRRVMRLCPVQAWRRNESVNDHEGKISQAMRPTISSCRRARPDRELAGESGRIEGISVLHGDIESTWRFGFLPR